MTLQALVDACDLEVLSLADGTRTVDGAYAGDLLSWVMGRAECDNAFLTIMTNVNVVAVAALADLSCIIFCENVPVGEDVLAAARERGINLVRSAAPVYETCLMVGQHLS